MLLDRAQHVAEIAQHMRPDRFALERAGPHPRQFALTGGGAEMVRPECHQPFDEATLCHGGTLKPRQRLGAERLLDDVERLRRLLARRRIRLHRIGRRHRRCSVGLHLEPGLWRQFLRQVLPHALGQVVSNSCHRLRSFRGGFALLLDVVLIVEHGLRQRRRRLQTRRIEQRRAGPAQFRLDESAGIGSRTGKIAGCAAARAKPEPVECDKSALRVTRHSWNSRLISPTEWPNMNRVRKLCASGA